MVLTRSQSGDRRDDEDRARFVQEQNRAAERRATASRRAAQVEQPEDRPGPSGLHFESPESPDDAALWRGDLDRHLHNTSGRATEQLVAIDAEQERVEVRPPTTGRALNVTFSGAVHEPPRAESVRSHATNASDRRRRELRMAELEQENMLEQEAIQAMEQLAKLKMERVKTLRDRNAEISELRRQNMQEEELAPPAGPPQVIPIVPTLHERIDEWLTRVPAEPSRNREEPTIERGRSSSPQLDLQTPSRRERSSSQGRAIDRLTDQVKSVSERLDVVTRPPPPRQVYELPVFSGEPAEWLMFYNSYQDSTARFKYSALDNVARLRNCLKGEAKQCVHHMLASATQPDLIMKVLKKNFGRPDLVIDRAIDELKKLPPLGPSASDLNQFAIKVVNIVSTLVNLDRRSYGANPLLIREVTDRLSPHLRSRWCAYARERLSKSPELNELGLMAEFLFEESDAEMEYSHARAPKKPITAVTSRDRGAAREPRPRPMKPHKESRPGGFTYATEQAPPSCLCCGGVHRTPECRKLLTIPAAARWDWARLNRVCYRCLDSKHRRDACRAPRCGAPGCPHLHHKLLHHDSSTSGDVSSAGSTSHRHMQAASHMPQPQSPALYAQYAPAPPMPEYYGPAHAPSARAPRARAPLPRARAPPAHGAPSARAAPQSYPAQANLVPQGYPASQAPPAPHALNTPYTEHVQTVDHEPEFTSNHLSDHTLDCPYMDCFTGCSASENSVLLKIVPVRVSGPRGELSTFALLDPGSTVSLIDEQLSNEIGASGSECAPLKLQGVGSMKTTQTSRRVWANVRGQHVGSAHAISLRTVQNLGLRTQRAVKSEIISYAHLRDLESACYNNAHPSILIGADNWHLMLPYEVRVGRVTEPAAMLTPLGWTVFGTLPTKYKNISESVMHFHVDSIDAQLRNHFDIDALGISKVDKRSPENQRAEKIFTETVKKIDGPRYEVGQLWRTENPKLPPSYAVAYKRLVNLERKMERDETFKIEYTAQIQNLIRKGYASRAVDTEDSKTWFLPHFAVRNPNKPGKIRLVFDAAAQSQGQCLNDFILEGPDKLQSLIGILLRFREGSYAVTADIAEMFLQIHIRKQDKPSQLFLWRTDRSRAPDVFQMDSMIFGAASSPFLAHSVRNENARLNAEKYPLAVNEILNNHYMDDFVASFESEEKAIETASQVAASHKEGGFTLRGWSSNSKSLMAHMNPELHATVPATLGGTKTQKILGLKWDPESDELGFNTTMIRVPAAVMNQEKVPTKREMLSAVMSIYDPLGLISQYVITAKVQLQRLWARKTDWDEQLPEDEATEFFTWLSELESVATLRVPRQLASIASGRRELHVFVDGSSQAYAVAAYWKITNGTHIQIRLVAAKAKVVPKKPISIPRVELQAALIGSRLQQTITREQKTKPDEIILWTDSRTVLHWVRNDAMRYSAYVSHRLGEIAELTTPQQWRWVPTKENPADDATRADCTRRVSANDRWYRGPDFLWKPSSEWPQETLVKIQPNELEEKMEHANLYALTGGGLREATQKKFDIPCKWESPLPDIDRFSKYDRLIGATARILQFADILKEKRKMELTLPHIKRAEHMWIQQCQRQSFSEEISLLANKQTLPKSSRLFKFDPFLDEDGVMKMRGRIDAAPTCINKRPIILDGRNQFVRLLLQREHERAAHANNERVVNDVRQKFWILRLRPSVRAISNACRTCILRRARPQAPALGDLPHERLVPYQRPFTYAATDYFGPLWVTIGRRREKRWVALFTCLSTRAVHLEIVHSLSTESALMALRRMAARRGWPRLIWSDNATNFRAADQELKTAYSEWAPALQRYGLTRNMEWRFIAPGAPNQGGAWERLVRSVKTALTATLHTRAPKEEVLLTLLAEAEHTVNARPLTHISVDHRDDEALTPFHFLLGASTSVPLTGPCVEADRRTWRAAQALADHFWARWVKEYLPLLAPRQSSARDNQREMQVGDYVIIADHTLPRNVWPRGIIVATHPGADGRVRNVEVRTRGGVFRRPTSRLVVIPCNGVDNGRRGESVDDSLHSPNS